MSLLRYTQGCGGSGGGGGGGGEGGGGERGGGGGGRRGGGRGGGVGGGGGGVGGGGGGGGGGTGPTLKDLEQALSNLRRWIDEQSIALKDSDERRRALLRADNVVAEPVYVVAYIVIYCFLFNEVASEKLRNCKHRQGETSATVIQRTLNLI